MLKKSPFLIKTDKEVSLQEDCILGSGLNNLSADLRRFPGGHLGQFLLGMCRWPLRTPTPL